MKPLRHHRAQLVVIFTLFFFFLNLFTLVLLGLFQSLFVPWGMLSFVLVPFLATFLFALLAWFVLFIWKKSPTEMEQMGQLLDALVEGVVVIDRHMRVRLMNRRAAAYLSQNPKNIVGKHFTSEQTTYIHLVKEALKLQKPVMAVVKAKRGGAIFDVTAFCREKQRFVVLVMQDQTNVHKAVEQGRDFIANASHELKTPITIVRGFAETLHEHPELSPEVMHDITGRILDNCERMVSLVQNLLTLAAIDEGIPYERLQKFDPKEMIEKAKATILAIHPKAEITLTQEQPLFMTADKELLLQALINLLDNAVKYSGERAKVAVVIKQDVNETKIIISDSGQGIARENLERIFERFYAIDKTLSRSLGGYGLGLSIVHRIVEKHHGHIDVTSEEGKGTTFTLTFPRINGTM